ncbi:MAG: hypothetical protein JST22_06900 [Bacteroidetes bacterium]|nr:hypothetical protein [Bacteroidota bacterium]
MTAESSAMAFVPMPGVFVPFSVVQQLDESLAALYGLIEAGLTIITDEVPEGIEVTIITFGTVAAFFRLYHTLNNARLLQRTSFDASAFNAPASDRSVWHRPAL